MKKQSYFSFERYASRRLYYSFDFLADTRDILYSANTSGQFNVWRQSPPDRNGLGVARQLTGFVDWSVRHIASLPDGETLLAFADKDGDENYQIFQVDANNGWQAPVVFKPDVRHEFGIRGVSPNGRLVAYASNEREPKDMDIVVTEISNGKTRKVLADGGGYAFGYWSPNGRYSSVMETISTDDYNILLLDMKTGKKTNLTPHKDKAQQVPGPWTPSGGGFYVLTNHGREFAGIAHMSLPDGKMEWVETPDCEVSDVALSPNGQILAWVENRESYSHVILKDLKTGRQLGHALDTGGALFPGWFDNLSLIKFSPDGHRLIMLLSKPTLPAEIFVFELAKRQLTKYTNGFVGNIPEKELVKPQLVRYDSFDRKVPAFLYQPRLQPSEKAPALVVVHGGPESQERPQYAYAGLYQFLVSRNIGVMALNIRGSIGYGKKYQNLIHHDWGGGELRDIDHAAKYLKSLDWVDPDRLGIFGGSFGGFAVLSATTRLPEHWKAAVDIFGVSNLVTFAKSAPKHWSRFMADWLGDPDTETDFLMSRSPITYIDNLNCAILIIQGAKDPRVVKAESDQIVEKLRSKGRKVVYVVFEDEGHGFTKQKNEFTTWKLVTEFLLENLSKQGSLIEKVVREIVPATIPA